MAFGFLKKAAPMISTALSLGGPWGAMAGAVLNKALGTKPDASIDDIEAVIGKSADQLKALQDLKAQEQQFEMQMKEMDIHSVEDLEKIAADDRANARDLQKVTKSFIPASLAIGVTIGFFVLLVLMVLGKVKSADNPAVLLLLGSLSTSWGGIIAFYFGSSAGSARKTELLSQAPPVGDK